MSSIKETQYPEIRDVLKQFKIHDFQTAERMNDGLIHMTLCVTADNQKYTLQRLHDVISDLAVEDMRIVTDGLHKAGMHVPSLVRASNGQSLVRDQFGKRWRLYPWMEGKTFNSFGEAGVADRKAMAYQAGYLVAQLHNELAKLHYTPVGSIPHFHDTEHVLKRLSAVADKLPASLQETAREILTDLPKIIIEAPKQLIHGDLKISNLLFDQNNNAVGMIDFDTLLEHDRFVDIGDALRSWCNLTSEDDVHAKMDMPLFDAAFAGYAKGSSQVDERGLFLQATRRIAFELSARFLTDVVEDNYFGFDPTKYETRREANIARAMGQFSLGRSIPQM